jgi:4-diphosphocytidyl-2-C-methyl-D-erythritol kinase
VLIAPGVHVSTAEAYRRLSERLTDESQGTKMFGFQAQVWSDGGSMARNDFEAVVFEQHPRLATLKRRLLRAGAQRAMMSGSGSSIFGLFDSAEDAAHAIQSLQGETALRISFVGRARYRAMFGKALAEHIDGKSWPPRSRY